jgi:NADH-quinone oxidoreductase subunit M
MDFAVFGFNDIVLSLKVTHLANFFAVLIAFSSLMLLFIARNYALGKSFYALFAVLVSSLFLIIYAHDYLLFFIGWETMSISTYFLLSFTLNKEVLHRYIIFAMASALSFFIAILMLYASQHSFLYADAHASFEAMGTAEGLFFIGLMLFGIFIKIGMIGFHYWLIDTYESSHNIFTPFLSAILSKMGIYALIILVVYVAQPSYVLAMMGVISSVVATFKAINEDSVKRLLAYSSIAQLGYIVTVLGVADGMGGALYHSLIHTAVKLLLFINVAGIIFVTGREKLSELGGLIYKMPQSFVLLLIGIIVLAGMPPLGGFASKFMIYTSLLDAKYLLILSAVMFSSASAFLYIYKLIYGIYLGHPTHKKLESVAEVPVSFLIPQYLLSLVLIVIGTFPALIVPYLNAILKEFDLNPITCTNATTLITPHAEYNGFIVMGAFIAVFVTVLLVFMSLRSKAKDVKNRFDIAYCGEEPNEGTHLHYGYGIGKELKRVGFINVILKNSIRYVYDFLAQQTLSFSEIFRKIYSGNISLNINIAIGFFLILLWWSLK